MSRDRARPVAPIVATRLPSPTSLGLREAAVDLLLGGRCVSCGAGGALLCGRCRLSTVPEPAVRLPDPTPPGLVTAWSATTYGGAVRDAVVAHKERGLRGLRPLLSDLLATAVEAAAPGPGVLLLVPVPSRRESIRERGHDPLLDLVRGAARRLRRIGGTVHTAQLLRSRAGVLDQSGLDAGARRDNLAGSMAGRGQELARWARRGLRVRIVICDDVLTTGSTAREAQRALESLGVRVDAIATIAATERRHRPGRSRG